MRLKTGGFQPPLFLTLLLYVLLFLINVKDGAADKSKSYSMQTLCKNTFLQQLYRKIDGAVLWSQNERNLDCVITFQTHSILQRFMLRFDGLQLDCNDHLYIYDGAHAVGTYKFDLSCKNTKQTLGAMFTRTNYVTLKYVTDNWGTDSNGFKLVITAVKDPKHTCMDFRCNLREFCIATDLVCDGINHCADGSDETFNNLCKNTNRSTILGMELTWFVVFVVSSILVISVLIVALSFCVCKKKRWSRPVIQQNATYSTGQMYASNNGHVLKQASSTTTLADVTSSTTTTLPQSGNWPHPVGPIGFQDIKQLARARPFCPAG